MCTLIAFHRVWDEWPLVVATNRDEAYDRPASGPAWSAEEPRVLAPRDERAGGTWMGANERGVWVGLTNRRSGSADPARRSRGLLCRDLLAEPTARAVARRLEDLEERTNPFNLLAADADAMFLVEHEGGRSTIRRLEAGCHLITNRPFDRTSDEPKARRAWECLYRDDVWPAQRTDHPPADLEARLMRILADHGRTGPDAVCLHGGSYGTRSAAVWRLGPTGSRAIRLTYAGGPPCSTDARRVDQLD